MILTIYRRVEGGLELVWTKCAKFYIIFDWVLPTLKTFDLGLKLLFYLIWKVSGGWWVGACTYDYSVSLSPNIWIMTFDLDLDLGLTIYLENFIAILWTFWFVKPYGMEGYLSCYINMFLFWYFVIFSCGWNWSTISNMW